MIKFGPGISCQWIYVDSKCFPVVAMLARSAQLAKAFILPVKGDVDKRSHDVYKKVSVNKDIEQESKVSL